MQKEFITQMHGIKEKYIEVNHLEITNNDFQVELSKKVRTAACPNCKHKTCHIHGYRNQCIQGRRREEKPVVLHLRKRRYKCINCGSTFYEPLSFVHRYQRRTTSLNEQALAYASDNSFTMAGRRGGVSTPRLIRRFDKRKLPQRQVLPKVIAMDEFTGDAGKARFQTIIVDVEKKELIEM